MSIKLKLQSGSEVRTYLNDDCLNMITKSLCILIALISIVVIGGTSNINEFPVYEAKNLEFSFPSENEREIALQTGLYQPESTIPIDVQPYYEAKHEEPVIFVTIPRFGKGVPYSLAYLQNGENGETAVLQPYPNYAWHKSHGMDCDGLTSVYRVFIDACNRLWVLDSGEIEFQQFCAPQIVAFDMQTGDLVHRYRLPESTYKTNTSRFVTPLVDVHDQPPYGKCEQTFIYMADSIGNGIVVYDMQQQKSWRIENKYTYPNQAFGTFTIAGESFELWDGVVGFAVTPPQLGLKRQLYFHALSNNMQMSVPLDVVNNASMWRANDVTAALNEFRVLGERDTQCVGAAMNDEGFLLCGLVGTTSISAWNIQKPFSPENIHTIAENADTLQFISSMKIAKNNEGREELWGVSNRLQRAFGGTIDYNEINYRILKFDLFELLNPLTGKATLR